MFDEELEANATDSPFKSIIGQIYREALTELGASVDVATGDQSNGILRWFKYLTQYFMPTAPVWSNLLLGEINYLDYYWNYPNVIHTLGDLHRHSRRVVRSFERLGVTQPEQRTTANSERRMGILKRAQLGKGNMWYDFNLLSKIEHCFQKDVEGIILEELSRTLNHWFLVLRFYQIANIHVSDDSGDY